MSGAATVLLAVLALAVVSMGLFALHRRGARDGDAERKGSHFLLGLGDFLLHWLLWAIGPAERALLAVGATPHHMNAAGLLLGLLSGVLIGSGRLQAGGWAIALAGVADILDGRLARALALASPYGKFIDSTLDRFVETFAFLGFAVYYRHDPWASVVVTAGLGGSLLVSYAQARGETVGVSGAGGLMQRAERLVLTALGCLLDPPIAAWRGLSEGSVLVWVLGLVAVGALGTAVQRTLRIARRLR